MGSKENETSRFLKDKEAEAGRQEEVDLSDTTCGFSIFKGPALQRCGSLFRVGFSLTKDIPLPRFATAKSFVIIYGIASCFLVMAFTYFTGTITTMEKRFNIPSKISGLITVGNDISTVFSSAFLSYYASRGHRPRWVAFGKVSLD